MPASTVNPKAEVHVFSEEMLAFREQWLSVCLRVAYAPAGGFQCIEGGEARGDKKGGAGDTNK